MIAGVILFGMSMPQLKMKCEAVIWAHLAQN